jgi:hypothetical protein
MVEHLFMNEFEEKIKEQAWHTFFKLPGDPDEVGGDTTEEIRLDPDSGEAELLLHAEGFTRVAHLEREHDKIEDCVQAYLADRFETAEVLGAAHVGADGRAIENEIGIEASVRLSALPSSSGDTWILPAEMVYGNSFLDDWSGPERGPFYVDATRQYSRVWRVPLPVGWSDIEGPAPVKVEHELLSFVAEVKALDGQLVVERRYRLKRGTVPKVRLSDLDAAINRIRDVERNPLVLQKTAR